MAASTAGRGHPVPEEWCPARSPKITRQGGAVYLLCQLEYGHEGKCSWEGRRPRGHAIDASLIDGEDQAPDVVEVELPEE